MQPTRQFQLTIDNPHFFRGSSSAPIDFLDVRGPAMRLLRVTAIYPGRLPTQVWRYSSRGQLGAAGARSVWAGACGLSEPNTAARADGLLSC